MRELAFLFIKRGDNSFRMKEICTNKGNLAPETILWHRSSEKNIPFPPQFPSLYFLFPFSCTLCEWAQFSGDQCFLRGNGHNKKYSPTLVRLSSAPGRFSQHSATSSRLDCVLGRGPGLRLHKGIPQFLFCSFCFCPLKLPLQYKPRILADFCDAGFQELDWIIWSIVD